MPRGWGRAATKERGWAGVSPSERGKRKKRGACKHPRLKEAEPILAFYPEPEESCFLRKVDFSIASDISAKDDPTAFFERSNFCHYHKLLVLAELPAGLLRYCKQKAQSAGL